MLFGLIETSKEIDEKLELFYNLHLNCPINLTAIKERNDFYLKHYLDSIYYFEKYEKPVYPVADIGSGGGFPAIVMGIFYKNADITLIESIGKKCDFLRMAIEKLDLKNLKVINDRAENIKGKKFATITARGVSNINDLLKNTLSLSDKFTKWIMYKGEKVYTELDEAKKVINKEMLDVETIRIDEPFTRTYCIISR